MANDQAKKVLGGAVPLRFIQIAIAQSGENDSGYNERLLGLDAEGQVWEYRCHAERLPDPQGRSYSDIFGPTYYWWQPLRMSAQKGPEFEEPPPPVSPA